eukprot:COSAG02_NODE_2516_length_8621_cov_3.609951_3_plen_86_part_00
MVQCWSAPLAVSASAALDLVVPGEHDRAGVVAELAVGLGGAEGIDAGAGLGPLVELVLASQSTVQSLWLRGSDTGHKALCPVSLV